MKHMKAVPQSKSKLAISAGLSALMVVSSLGVAPAMAFADQNPAPAKKSAVQNFEAIAKQVITYDASVLHPNDNQAKLNSTYRLDSNNPLVTPNDVPKFPAIEILARKAENKGLSFTATLIRQAKSVEAATNLLQEAEKAAVDTNVKAAQEMEEKLDKEESSSMYVPEDPDELAARLNLESNESFYSYGTDPAQLVLDQINAKTAFDASIELLAKKAESEGLSFAAKQIRKAKTLDGATNLLKEAEKSAIETLAQKAEKEGFTFAAKQIRKAKTVEGARALLKAAEDSKPNTPAKPSVSDVLSGLSADDMINKVAGFKLDKDVVEAIKKDLASTYNHDNNTETPGSDQTPAPDNSGDASNDQKPEGKEEDKAQAEKTPKTGDFFAALLPMLGVALGGTSIAFGKRMRH